MAFFARKKSQIPKLLEIWLRRRVMKIFINSASLLAFKSERYYFHQIIYRKIPA